MGNIAAAFGNPQKRVAFGCTENGCRGSEIKTDYSALENKAKNVLKKINGVTVTAASLIPAGRLVTSLYYIVKTPGYLGTVYGLEVINDVYNPSMPPLTPHGAALGAIKNLNEKVHGDE